MNRFSIPSILLLVLVVATLAGCGNGETAVTDQTMERTIYDGTKVSPSDWTGEVVKSEPLGHDLYKVQVRRSGSEKQDTLLATTELPVGTKVQELKVTSYGKNSIPQTTWFAVPATK